MARTASPKQIAFIRSLLNTKQHEDTGKTILVGETRFRTTETALDQISSAVASRMITALKAADDKSERTSPTKPHFTSGIHGIHGWIIANPDASWKRGDVVAVELAGGGTRTVRLEAQGQMPPGMISRFGSLDYWTFAAVTPTPEQEAADAAAAEERAEAEEMERIDREALDAYDKASAQAPATRRQVDTIWTLVCQGRHKEGGFYNGPTTLDGIRRMTRGDASLYIDSLTDNY